MSKYTIGASDGTHIAPAVRPVLQRPTSLAPHEAADLGDIEEDGEGGNLAVNNLPDFSIVLV